MKYLKGQTLLEILLYVSIFSVILTGIIFVYLNIFNSINKNQAIFIVNEQGEYILNLISKNINNSTAINYPASSSTANHISLARRNSANNPTLIYVDNGNLFIKEGTLAPIKLNNSKLIINNIQFTNISTSSSESTSIKITLDISYNLEGFGNELKYSSKFYTTANVR